MYPNLNLNLQYYYQFHKILVFPYALHVPNWLCIAFLF